MRSKAKILFAICALKTSLNAKSGLRRFHSPSCDSTTLKPAVNERVCWKPFRLLVILLGLSLASAVFATQTQDAEYEAVAEEYVKTYLAAHPLQGTALGFHEYRWKNQRLQPPRARRRTVPAPAIR